MEARNRLGIGKKQPFAKLGAMPCYDPTCEGEIYGDWSNPPGCHQPFLASSYVHITSSGVAKWKKPGLENSRHTTEVVAINKQGLWPVLSGANMTTRDDKWTGYFVGHQGRPGVVVAELNGNGEMSNISCMEQGRYARLGSCGLRNTKGLV